MRLSERLEEVLGLCDAACAMVPSPEGIAAIEAAETAAADFVIEFRDGLRQALRDSERLASAPAGSLRAPHLRPDGRGSIEVEFGKWPMVFFTGQRVRLVIEDAAMGRREGE